MRLKSVKSIEKITKSMKMVSAAKLNKAEARVKSLRSIGEGSTGSSFALLRCIAIQSHPFELSAWFVLFVLDKQLEPFTGSYKQWAAPKIYDGVRKYVIPMSVE